MKLFFAIITLAVFSISANDALAQRNRSSRDRKFRVWHNSRKGQVKKDEVHRLKFKKKNRHPKSSHLKWNNGRIHRSNRAYIKRNNGKKHFF